MRARALKNTSKRIAGRTVALILAFCLVFMTNTSTVHATDKTVSQAMNYLDTLVGQQVGSGQCVALIQAYYRYLGVATVSGNACDYATNALPANWTRVKGGVPEPGDILVYTGAKYGHVAIYAGGTVAYHQNMGVTKVQKRTNWNYNTSWYSSDEGGTKSYWGYIRPNFPSSNVTPDANVTLVEGVDGHLHIKGTAIDYNTPNQPVNMHVYFEGRAGHGGKQAEAGSTNPTTHEFDTYIETDQTGAQIFYLYFLDVEGFTELGPFEVYIPIKNEYLFHPAVYDDAWYAKYNDAVRNMTEEQRRQHWVKYGSSVGEQASPAFFAIEYKEANKDVADFYASTNDYQFYIKHFCKHGMGELRKGRFWFDPNIYIANYKDVYDHYTKTGEAPDGFYSHFVQYGYEEGRTAERRLQIYFDTSNGGTSSESQRDLTYGAENDGTVIGTLPTLTRQGYTGAWYTAKTGGTKVTPSFSLEHEFMVQNHYGDLTLYAQWTPIKVTGISIPGTQSLSIGESKTLTATVTPSNALNKNVTWKSSNTSVVTVTNGTIKGIKEGTATVTATASDGSNVSASCTVTVKPTITGLTLNRSSIQLASGGIGSTYALKVVKSPASGLGTVNWSTSNGSVAQVTQSGVVTAKGTGNVTITASVTNGPSVSCTVSVSNMSLMTLPADLKTVEEEAFLSTATSRIVIPSGVESIGARAFANSSALRYVAIPDSVVTIADSAFTDDPNLCIICSENSAAKAYAVSHGIEYITQGAANN